jgi:hypothetical protein
MGIRSLYTKTGDVLTLTGVMSWHVSTGGGWSQLAVVLWLDGWLWVEPRIGLALAEGLCDTSHFLWNPKVYYCVHKSPSLFPVLSLMNPVNNLPSYFPKIHSNIILPSIHPSSKVVFPSGSPTKIYAFLISSMRATYPYLSLTSSHMQKWYNYDIYIYICTYTYTYTHTLRSAGSNLQEKSEIFYGPAMK